MEGTGGTTSSVSQSEVPSGLAYYAAYAEQIAEKMDKVVNGDPENLNPDPMDESMITRYVLNTKALNRNVC